MLYVRRLVRNIHGVNVHVITRSVEGGSTGRPLVLVPAAQHADRVDGRVADVGGGFGGDYRTVVTLKGVVETGEWSGSVEGQWG